MDGSEPYGASRPDGWLDLMRRYVCTLGDGSNLILDLVQTKENRTALNLFGSQYGGPDFSEPSPASQRLNIDEYFYIDTEANIQVDGSGSPSEVLPWERGSTKWCSHVHAELLQNGSSIALRPACGIGGYRPGDGMGVISGMTLGNGQGVFEYDGLVTSVDRWLTPNALKKRRFRFVSDSTVGPEGNVRAFVLTPSQASNPLQVPPESALENCSIEIGCGALTSPIECSCVQMCVGQTLKRATIVNGELSNLANVGSC